MKRALALVLLTAILSSCISVGRKIDQARVDKIKKGETTREEVLTLLGSPDQIVSDGNGNVTFMYTFGRITPNPATFIPIVGSLAGGATVQHQAFIVTFGSDGVVRNLFSSRGALESGLGVNAASKANVEDVELNKEAEIEKACCDSSRDPSQCNQVRLLD